MVEDIRVLLIEPGEKPRLKTVTHTLEELQALVGGTVQAVYPFPDQRVALLCDDEGKFKGYTPNRVLLDEDGNPYDIVAGTFLICGITEDNFGSISDEDAKHFTEMFYWPEMFMRTLEGQIIWIRMKPGEQPKIIG